MKFLVGIVLFPLHCRHSFKTLSVSPGQHSVTWSALCVQSMQMLPGPFSSVWGAGKVPWCVPATST